MKLRKVNACVNRFVFFYILYITDMPFPKSKRKGVNISSTRFVNGKRKKVLKGPPKKSLQTTKIQITTKKKACH